MKKPDNIIVECRPHLVTRIVFYVFAGIWLVLAFMYLFNAEFKTFAIFLALAAIFVLIALVRKQSRVLYLTESSVSGKIGLLKTTEMTSPISKVQDISVSSNLFGKIFRYQTITVSTAGSGSIEYIFRRMTNVTMFQQKYLEKAT